MTPPTSVGYSGTPLAKKLGYREGSVAFLSGAPSEYIAWLQPLPPAVLFESELGAADLIHVFEVEKTGLVS